MFYSNPLGDWSDLVTRLDAARYPERWCADRRLAGLSTVQQLQDWTLPGRPAQADNVLGALVWRGAAAGGNDPEAVVVLLHLLRQGAERIAVKVAHLSPDPLALVLGQLAIQIRSFALHRRTRAYAANLLMDTHMIVWRELTPYRTDRPHRRAELLVDPIDDARTGTGRAILDRHQPGFDNDDLDLVDMLLWARRIGAVDPVDLAVLVELEYARDLPGVSPQKYVARSRGWSVRTVQRRRDRALISLRACSTEYLAAG